MKNIKVYGAEWCEDSQRTRRRLEELKIDYEYINVDHDQTAEGWIKEQNNGKRQTPTVVLDARILIEPSNSELDAALKA